MKIQVKRLFWIIVLYPAELYVYICNPYRDEIKYELGVVVLVVVLVTSLFIGGYVLVK